jgi:hypothetical protein
MTSSTSNSVEFPELTPASEAILQAYRDANGATNMYYRRAVAAALREAVYQAFPAYTAYSGSDRPQAHPILKIAANIHNVPPPTREQIADDMAWVSRYSNSSQVDLRLRKIREYIDMQQQELSNSVLIKDTAAINRPSARQALNLQ